MSIGMSFLLQISLTVTKSLLSESQNSFQRLIQELDRSVQFVMLIQRWFSVDSMLIQWHIQTWLSEGCLRCKNWAIFPWNKNKKNTTSILTCSNCVLTWRTIKSIATLFSPPLGTTMSAKTTVGAIYWSKAWNIESSTQISVLITTQLCASPLTPNSDEHLISSHNVTT